MISAWHTTDRQSFKKVTCPFNQYVLMTCICDDNQSFIDSQLKVLMIIGFCVWCTYTKKCFVLIFCRFSSPWLFLSIFRGSMPCICPSSWRIKQLVLCSCSKRWLCCKNDSLHIAYATSSRKVSRESLECMIHLKILSRVLSDQAIQNNWLFLPQGRQFAILGRQLDIR